MIPVNKYRKEMDLNRECLHVKVKRAINYLLSLSKISKKILLINQLKSHICKMRHSRHLFLINKMLNRQKIKLRKRNILRMIKNN